MTEFHDRQSMERLHQHLARADIELRDAQHLLDPGSAGGVEKMGLVHAVEAARFAVTNALERVRSHLGGNPGSERPSNGGPQSTARIA